MLEEARRLLKKDGKVMIIDWKKVEISEGPPLELRVTEVTIESQMRKSGFFNISKYAGLPYHHFLVGEKKA